MKKNKYKKKYKIFKKTNIRLSASGEILYLNIIYIGKSLNESSSELLP